jgi:hypothetical protein
MKSVSADALTSFGKKRDGRKAAMNSTGIRPAGRSSRKNQMLRSRAPHMRVTLKPAASNLRTGQAVNAHIASFTLWTWAAPKGAALFTRRDEGHQAAEGILQLLSNSRALLHNYELPGPGHKLTHPVEGTLDGALADPGVVMQWDGSQRPSSPSRFKRACPTLSCWRARARLD